MDFEHSCVDFLKKLAEEMGIDFTVYYPASKLKPVVVLTLLGSQPELKSIMLNSHMDVVPVFEEFWSHKPFDAHMDEDGKIFARGSQDMKCVGMQYLGALRYFKNKQMTFKRTIHVTFVPDEEIFGEFGMKAFSLSESFKKLNVGFLLDEGIASPNETFDVFCGEKTCWHVLFKVYGQPGHGSLLLEDTAAEKLRTLLDQIYDFRSNQEKTLNDNPELTLGDITTVNVTRIQAGKQRNVLPPLIEVTVDCRIALTSDLGEFEVLLNTWATKSGKKVEVEFLVKEEFVPATETDESNIFWKAFKKTFDDMNLKIKLQVFPAGTDAAYIRRQNIPALGFSPMNFTPILLHDHNEFLKADVYLKGIEIYKNIIANVANVV